MNPWIDGPAFDLAAAGWLDHLGFHLAALVTVVSGALVVTLRNLVHCVIALAATMLGVAALFVRLDANFLAMVQIFLYVGGVTVLFLFAVMLTSGIHDKRIATTNAYKAPALLLALAFGLAIWRALAATRFAAAAAAPAAAAALDPTDSLGVALLTTWIVPFEVVSLLLLAALVGAIAIAREEKR